MRIAYLEKIDFDAVGLPSGMSISDTSEGRDDSVLEGYRVADYREQPYTYAEDSE